MRGDGRRVILVVDDHAGNREVLQCFLSWRGYMVLEATNGQEAVELVAADNPDLVIMDLAMPVMDGFTAAKILRQTTQVPIIAYTAFDTPDHRAHAHLIGFNRFLPKPVSFDVLASMLDQLLG